ncbi:MAG: DUF3592 domain-containing protein [Candidatus Enterenecus sp.]
MSLLRLFGAGEGKIIGENTPVTGTVTEVKTCWWLKVNTRPARLHALDGAQFPHIIHFTYAVDGAEYRGSRYVSWSARCPREGEKLTVYVDPERPGRYAVKT